MILETIKSFPEQLKYKPEIKNPAAFEKHDKFIIAGMGGSNLASGLIKIWKPESNLIIHRDYGLPVLAEKEKRLIIASSYSGNTEETISAFSRAAEFKIPIVAISIGGKLLELAKELGIPYIQMPDTDTQPRLALGFSLKAMLKIMGEKAALDELENTAGALDPGEIEPQGKELSQRLNGRVPMIYSSRRNKPLAYIWKVIINEGAKIPAFCNAFSELNHNEMIGFDGSPDTKPLSEKYHFVFLRDEADDERILKRMDLTQGIYNEKGLEVEIVDLSGKSVWEKIFRSFTLANWTAYHLAQSYGIDPEKIEMVEKFKKMMAEK